MLLSTSLDDYTDALEMKAARGQPVLLGLDRMRVLEFKVSLTDQMLETEREKTTLKEEYIQMLLRKVEALEEKKS